MSSTKKVLFTVNSRFIGGAERSLERIANSIERTGFTPFVVSGYHGAVEKMLATRGIRHTSLPLVYPDRNQILASCIGLCRMFVLMKRERISIFHANDITAFPVAGIVARLLRIPRVCHVRFTYEAGFLKWLLRFGFEQAVFASEYMMRYAQETCPELFPVEKCIVIRNGFDPPASPDSLYLKSLRDRLDIPSQNNIVGFFGQVIELKGIKEFLSMAKLVSTCLSSNVTFLVVGDDKQKGSNYRMKMESYAKKMGIYSQCLFLGFREDVWGLLHLCDLVVMPSRVEPLGNVAIEAGAAGKPVVASNTGGLPEIILDGQTGFLVPVGSIDHLTQKVLQLLKEKTLRIKLGMQASVHIKNKFSMERQIYALAKIYNKQLRKM